MTVIRRYLQTNAIAAAVLAALCAAGPATAETKRVVIALDPPTAETNLFWSGIGERMPSMQALVGNDPVTGRYDNSELSESWETNPEFTEWTFTLHEGAEFHFGWGPVTAHDVVHSYELHTGPDSTIVGLAHLRADSVEALDDRRVVFRFAEPRTDYAFHHAGRGSLVVYSKAQYEADGMDGYHQRPAGTGPYQFVERRVGEGILFERAPEQWQGVVPEFEELELRWAAEASTKLALLLTGEAHITDLPRELQAQALAAGHKVVASQNPAMQTGANFGGLYQRSGDPAYRPDLPWANIKVREAMNRALDRQQMIEVLYDGRARPVPSWIMHGPHEGYLPELEERFESMYGYDPERAKALLAEVGYPGAFPDPVIPIVSSTLAGNPEFPVMAELLQVFFEAIGLQTEIREMDWATLGGLGRARQAYLITPIRNAPIRPTEAGLINFFTTRGTPYGGWESDTIEALADDLGRTIDPAERTRIAQDAFRYLFESYADMPLAALDFELAVNPAVVAGWTFPGVTPNAISHYHMIEAAR